MKNKVKFTINNSDYQNRGKYFVGTWHMKALLWKKKYFYY